MIFSKRWKFHSWRPGFKKTQRRKCTIFILSKEFLTHRKTQEGHTGKKVQYINLLKICAHPQENSKRAQEQEKA